MAITINTNLASTRAQFSLGNSTQQLNKTMQRMNDGVRITSAADDAGGLYISKMLSRDVSGLQKASANALNAKGLAETAESFLKQINTQLQTINSNAMEAANGTYSAEARAGLQKVVDEATRQINNLVETAEFNGQKLLSRDAVANVMQIGISNDEASTLRVGLEGGLAAQGEARKFTFAGTNDRFFSADQANAVAVPTMAQALFEKDKDPSDIWDNATYTAVTVTNLQSADEDDQPVAYQISEGLKQLGNNDSFTVDGMTFTRQKQDFNDKIGQQLKIEFNGKSTTVDGTWDASTGALEGGTSISTDNLEDLFGEAGKESTYALANEYFGYNDTPNVAATTYAGDISISDLKVHKDEDLLATLKGGESVTFEGITYKRVEDATNSGDWTKLQITSASMVKAVEIDGVFEADKDTRGVDDPDKLFQATDFDDLFGNAAQGLGVMGDLLNGDLNGTKVIDISTQDAARNAIEFTREAMGLIAELQATFGAQITRLDSTRESNDDYRMNLDAARGRIEDTDIATEAANLAKYQVMQQVSAAMLGQANASSQIALSLI